MPENVHDAKMKIIVTNALGVVMDRTIIQIDLDQLFGPKYNLDYLLSIRERINIVAAQLLRDAAASDGVRMQL